MRSVDVIGVHLEITSGSPFVLLREHEAPHRILPLFVGSNEALAIALALSGQAPPRPMAHDLMASLVHSLNAEVTGVEVTEVCDGAFLAELALSGPGGEHRLDTRPSDGIALALRVDAPLYVSDQVLDQAAATLTVTTEAELLDPEDLDSQVAEFRSFLETADLGQLEAGAEPNRGDRAEPGDGIGLADGEPPGAPGD